jgi:hypothetical protein
VDALYWTPPKPEELAFWGFSAEEVTPPATELWAQNADAIQLFRHNATQWRVGMHGYVGLDYSVLFHELDRRKLPSDEYDDLMGCLRVIEEAALKHLHKPA